jgi:hypothetical protein
MGGSGRYGTPESFLESGLMGNPNLSLPGTGSGKTHSLPAATRTLIPGGGATPGHAAAGGNLGTITIVVKSADDGKTLAIQSIEAGGRATIDTSSGTAKRTREAELLHRNAQTQNIMTDPNIARGTRW